MADNKLNLDFNLLKCFRLVAESESLTAASQVLHLSQPAISIQIKRFEEQLGQKLFDRHNRGLKLTPFGKKILAYSSRVTEFENELGELLRDEDSEPKGRVRIGTYSTASAHLLAAPIAPLLAKFPELTISYSYDPTETIIDRIKNYTLECGVFTDVPEDKSLSIVPIKEDRLVFAQSSKRKKPKGGRIDPDELSEIEFLSYPLRYELCYRKVEQRFGSRLAKAKTVVESENFDTLKQMLLLGAGATFIPRYLIERELDRGEVVEIDVGNIKLPIIFSFVTKKEATQSAATLAVRDSITSYYSR